MELEWGMLYLAELASDIKGANVTFGAKLSTKVLIDTAVITNQPGA